MYDQERISFYDIITREDVVSMNYMQEQLNRNGKTVYAIKTRRKINCIAK